MIRKLRAFEYFAPATMPELLAILEKYGKDARIFAGGTDLLVGMKESGQSPKYLVDVKHVPELTAFSYDDRTGLRLGAATTIRKIETSQLIQQKYPHLAQGANAIGSIQIRHRATVGGNICNASPCADTVPNLMVSGARLILQGPKGCRELPIEEFFRGPGVSVLADNEILVEIRVPANGPQTYSRFANISRRKALDLSLASVAVQLDLPDPKGPVEGIRVALGSVGPTVFRAKNTEELLQGKFLEAALMEQAGRSAAADSRPIDDIRASAWYRREVMATMFRRALQQIVEEANDRGRE